MISGGLAEEEEVVEGGEEWTKDTMMVVLETEDRMTRV